MVLVLGVVSALVFLVAQIPTTMPLVVGGLLSPLLIAVGRNTRKAKKKVGD